MREPSITDVVRSGDGVKVFDFHPIHIFLNTECISRYERTRKIHQYASTLLHQRYQGYGARNMLKEILLYND